MTRRSIFVLCFVMLLSGFAAAQGKVVTNADLEKFRQKREAGERNLKAYYAKNGMTAADVAKQEAEDAEAREQLSARLRSERLEREWLEQERMEREMAPPQVNVYVPQHERNNSAGWVAVFTRSTTAFCRPASVASPQTRRRLTPPSGKTFNRICEAGPLPVSSSRKK